MFDLAKIIGLKVLAIKGKYNAKGKNIGPKYILFDDGKTYIELDEQDYYTYHDCSSSARHITATTATPEYWEILLTYPNSTTDI